MEFIEIKDNAEVIKLVTTDKNEFDDKLNFYINEYLKNNLCTLFNVKKIFNHNEYKEIIYIEIIVDNKMKTFEMYLKF